MQLIRVAEYLNEMREQKRGDSDRADNYVVFLLCDMAKAFDRSARWLLLQQLIDLGISGKLLNAVAAFLCDRKQFVCVDGEESEITSTLHGFPQGGVISLFAFLLYVNSLPEELHHAISSLYVDDCAGIYCATKPLALLESLLDDFKRMHAWSVKHQQVFAPAKFHLLNIGKPERKLRKAIQSRAIYDGTAVQWSRSVNFLGAMVDSNLRFAADLRAMTKKVNQNAFKIWLHNHERSGCSVNFQLRSFQEHVLSHLLHGSGVWIFVLFPDVRLHAQPQNM